MKMIYLQKSRSNKKRNALISIAVVLGLVALFGLGQFFAGGALGRIALSAGGPFASAYTGLVDGVSFTTAVIKSRSNLVLENRRLRQEIEKNTSEQNRFETLEEEYKTLLEAYGRRPITGSVVLANVISKPPQSPYDVLIVDVGENVGIDVGAEVYGLGGIPIGLVHETVSGTSRVVLFSSVGEEHQATLNRTGATITLKGVGGGNIEAQAAQDLDVRVGDTVSLPVFGGAVVAEVVDIEHIETQASKTVLLKVPVNVFHTRFVEIIKK